MGVDDPEGEGTVAARAWEHGEGGGETFLAEASDSVVVCI